MSEQVKSVNDQRAFAKIGRQLGIILVIVLSWGLLLGVLLASHQTAPPTGTVAIGEELTWDEHIRPIMQRYCLLCHGSSGGLNLSSYEQALRGGNHGPAIIPGDAEKSLLYRLLLGPVNGIPAMPLGQARLSEETLRIIRDWINQLPSGP